MEWITSNSKLIEQCTYAKDEFCTHNTVTLDQVKAHTDLTSSEADKLTKKGDWGRSRHSNPNTSDSLLKGSGRCYHEKWQDCAVSQINQDCNIQYIETKYRDIHVIC